MYLQNILYFSLSSSRSLFLDYSPFEIHIHTHTHFSINPFVPLPCLVTSVTYRDFHSIKKYSYSFHSQLLLGGRMANVVPITRYRVESQGNVTQTGYIHAVLQQVGVVLRTSIASVVLVSTIERKVRFAFLHFLYCGVKKAVP